MAVYTWDPATGTYILSADQLFVTTDQSDYVPGQTVQITANFAAGSTVQLEVAHDIGAGADGIWGTADDVLSYDLAGTGFTWTVTADSNGLINASWFVNNDALGQTFVLTATELGADGTASGPTATTFFTDGGNITYNDPPVLPAPGTVGGTPFAGLVNLTGANQSFVGDLINPVLPVTSFTDNNGGVIFHDGTSQGSVGSGNFNSFVRINAGGSNPTEQGYNTDARANGFVGPIDDPNNEANSSSQFTHSLDVNTLAKVNADGTLNPNGLYYVFALDVNQTGHDGSLISLDALQIYQSGSANLDVFDPAVQQGGGGTGFGSSAHLVYNLDGVGDQTVLINAGLVGHGSGLNPDIDVFVPVADFDSVHGNFIYLYSSFGQQPGYSNTGGYEEFGALIGSNSTTGGGSQNPLLSIAKTAVSAPPSDTLNDGTGPLADHSGELITYQVVLTNTGSAAATNVVLSDTLVSDTGQFVLFTDVGATDHAAYTLSNFETGKLDAGETWTLTYTYAVQQSDLDNNGNDPTTPGFIDNTATATSHELPPVSSSAQVLVDQDPSINIEKLVSVDGGLNWYFSGDTDDTNYFNAIQTALGLGHTLHLGSAPAVNAGYPVMFEVAVTDNGNVTDHNLSVTDNTGLHFALGADLAPGATELSTAATIVAQFGAANSSATTDTATVNGTTDTAGNVSDSDSATYHGLFVPGAPTFTQGYWNNFTQHPWHNTSANGVLLGDLNNDGKTDDYTYTDASGGSHTIHESTIFVPTDAAKAILAGSTVGDERVIMLAQAIAAQLNIDNHSSEPNDLITEAVNWLKGTPGTELTNPTSLIPHGEFADGILNSTEYTIKKGAITINDASLNSTSGLNSPWHQYQIPQADGEGIKNALMDWNDGHLVVGNAGLSVAWDPTGGGGANPANLEFFEPNTTDQFWLTLHQAGTAAGAGIA
jgi:uncharacterized repeat protein (TIGR01451 family)